MSSILARTAMRTAVRRPLAPAVARRSMSGDAQHAIEEMERWKKISVVMLAGSLVIGAFQMIGEGHHHHEDDGTPLPSYRKIRNKPFPWACSHCDLIDKECFRKCRAERGEA